MKTEEQTRSRGGMLDELLSRESIRETLHRYARGCDRADVEEIRSCYHSDAVEVHGDAFVGRAHDYAEYMARQLRELEFAWHAITNDIIELDGDRAFVECQYTCVLRMPVPEGPEGTYVDWHLLGRYLDVFERREDGRWRIAHRHLVRDGDELRGVVGQGGRNDPRGGRLGRADSDDAVYLGFEIVSLTPPPTQLPNGYILRAAERFESVIPRPAREI